MYHVFELEDMAIIKSIPLAGEIQNIPMSGIILPLENSLCLQPTDSYWKNKKRKITPHGDNINRIMGMLGSKSGLKMFHLE